MAYVIPPDEVFQTPPKPLADTQGAYTIPAFEHLTFTEREGMMGIYTNRPFPRKGLVYPEAVEANNVVKKFLVLILRSIVTPWNFLKEFLYSCDYAFRNYYLQRRFYCNFSRAIWDFTYSFTKRLGIKSENAYRLGKIIAHVFQYEENYRFWVQDMFGQTTKQELIEHPQRELKKMMAVFSRRMRVGVQFKFDAVIKILCFLLYIPPIKKAWQFAWQDIDFSTLLLDEADRWWMLSSADYDLEDRNIEQRFTEHVDIYNQHQLKIFKQQIINQNTNAVK